MNTRRTLAVVALAASSVVSSSAQGAALTWKSTADTTNNTLWSVAANWSPAQQPTSGDTLIFNVPVTSGSRTSNNDLAAGMSIAGITVPANQMVLTGNNIGLAGDYAFTGQSTTSTSFTNTLSIPITLLQNVNFSVAGPGGTGLGASRIDAGATIDGNFGITKTGTGVLRLTTVAKTYTGDTLVSAGTLEVNTTDNLLPFGVGKGNLAIDSGAFLLNGNTSWQINGLNNGPNGAGQITRSGTNTKTLTLGNADANGSFSGNITSTGGSSSLNKVGTGTQTLGGTVTLAGTASITTGRLIVDGTFTNGVTAFANGTLGGTGAIGGTTTITGKLEPGTLNGDAVIGTAALVLNSTGITTLDLDGLAREAQYDGVDSTGAVTYGGTLNLDVGSALPLGGVFDLFAFGATVPTGSFSAINLTGAYTGALTNNGAGIWSGTAGSGTAVFTQATGDLVITVPEPTALLGLTAAAGLFARRRR